MQALAFLPFSATVLAHAPPMRCFPPGQVFQGPLRSRRTKRETLPGCWFCSEAMTIADPENGGENEPT